MIKLTIRFGESPERFLQRFKRLCAKQGVFRELKRRRFYEKPSEKQRRRAKEAKSAAIRAERRSRRRKIEE